MNFQYHNLTDEELVSAVLAQEDPTEFELELLDRMERLEARVEDLENDLETVTQTRDILACAGDA